MSMVGVSDWFILPVVDGPVHRHTSQETRGPNLLEWLALNGLDSI